MQYILTKYEIVQRTEKVEYKVEIPKKIKNKKFYAERKVLEGEYFDCKVADIVDSEMLDEEVGSFKKHK